MTRYFAQPAETPISMDVGTDVRPRFHLTVAIRVQLPGEGFFEIQYWKATGNDTSVGGKLNLILPGPEPP